jgi:DNA-binding response OmpR family regulator
MPARIVLVEDEQNIRDSVSYALRQEGHQVTGYADGEEAWKALERRLPDLLILDILLPRLDGLELCRRVRARSESVPLMFLTSRDEEFDRVLGLELGADDYLCKPFSVRELCARVKVLLRGVRRRARRGCAWP